MRRPLFVVLKEDFMHIENFEMERWQSIWENQVRFNLSESGVHPMQVSELLEASDLKALESQLLGYPQTNGTVELRERVSDLYPGSDVDNIIVTNGTAEANFISVFSLVEPGDEVVMMIPNYMQIWGLTRSLGTKTIPFMLREDTGWAPDLDEFEKLVNEKTKLIAICNPNNPTGAILSEDHMRGICEVAGGVGAWVLADEVYQGAELDGETTPTFWGWYDRLLVTAGLSKAYGLPGLRIGWVVGPSEKVEELWSYKDYTSIAPGALSDYLARRALEPQRRAQILERTRSILNKQIPLVHDWVNSQSDILVMTPPKAGAFAVVRYKLDVNSTDLIERLRTEKSVLIVPGDQFQLDHYVRIGYGGEPEVVKEGLALFSELLTSVCS
jgi:aspartate/methionine/tyrosine aminotransferase